MRARVYICLPQIKLIYIYNFFLMLMIYLEEREEGERGGEREGWTEREGGREREWEGEGGGGGRGERETETDL